MRQRNAGTARIRPLTHGMHKPFAKDKRRGNRNLSGDMPLIGLGAHVMTYAQLAEEIDPCPVVLVVEDEWVVRMAVVDALREVGWSVVEAASGAEAVEYIQSGSPLDLILSDVRMAGPVDGLALLAFTQSAAPRVPVILSSGHLDPTIAIGAGATAFLAKPYSMEAMAALIDATLAASR